MRIIAFASLLVLAACSEDAAADQKAKAAADAANLKLAAGQWETTTEITKVTSQDGGTPALKVADKSVVSTCVGPEEGKKPAPAVLAGMEECDYETVYMARGRVTASLSCSKPGLAGKVLVSTEGKYQAESFETSADIQTALSGDGDVRASAKITGRRTGECTPPQAAA